MACRVGVERPNVREMFVMREATSLVVKLRRSQGSQSERSFSFPVQSMTLK